MTEAHGEYSGDEEQRGPTNYLDFDYQDRRYTVQRSPMIDYKGDIVKSPKPNATIARLQIMSDDGTLHGEILGEFITDASDNETEFHSNDIKNKKIEAFSTVTKQPDHVSGIVRESIAQILVQKKISTWLSSDTLLKGGNITYDALLADSRLKGTKTLLPTPHDDGSPRYQYSLTKR